MGERDADEARRSQQFTARIVPIPSFGTKRIEMSTKRPIARAENPKETIARVHNLGHPPS